MESSDTSRTISEARQAALPAPVWRIVLFGTLSLAAGVGLARLALCTHVETYPGNLTARVVPVTADRAGVISQWLVREGENVRLAQPIAAMADPSIDRRRTELDAEIARLEAALDRALAKAELELDWRMKDVNQTIFAARLQSAEYLEEKHRHEMEKVALTDLLSHNSTAFCSQSDTAIDSLVLKESGTGGLRLNTVLRLESATNATEVCTAQVELCDEQVDWLEDLKEALPVRVRKSAGVDLAEQHLDAARAQRKALEDAPPQTLMTSTAIGRAGVFFKRVGDYACVGEPIVEVLDESQRFVVIDVPSEKVVQFTLGRELTVIFPGDAQRSGRVVRVAPQTTPDGTSAHAPAVVRVHVEQAGLVWPDAPIGSRVDACLSR